MPPRHSPSRRSAVVQGRAAGPASAALAAPREVGEGPPSGVGSRGGASLRRHGDPFRVEGAVGRGSKAPGRPEHEADRHGDEHRRRDRQRFFDPHPGQVEAYDDHCREPTHDGSGLRTAPCAERRPAEPERHGHCGVTRDAKWLDLADRHVNERIEDRLERAGEQDGRAGSTCRQRARRSTWTSSLTGAREPHTPPPSIPLHAIRGWRACGRESRRLRALRGASGEPQCAWIAEGHSRSVTTAHVRGGPA